MVAKNSVPDHNEISESGTDVAVRRDFSMVSDWETACELLNSEAPVVLAEEAFGDGSRLIKDKDVLVKRRFLVLDWNYNIAPETGREYVNVLIMDQDGNKARFNDGSSGVFQQCKNFEANHGRRGGIIVNAGLRKSTYKIEDGSTATTYYFASS